MSGLSIKLPLSEDTNDGYSMNKTLTEVAKQNLKMLVLTSPGERVMEPEFGIGLRRYFFELNNENTENEIDAKILEQVDKFLPYIKIQNIIYNSVGNSMHIRIQYSINSLGISDSLDVSLND